jgi:hypothetical protein
MPKVRISADSLKLCEALLKQVMGRTRGRHEGRRWKAVDRLSDGHTVSHDVM